MRRWKEHAHVPGLARLLLHLWGSDVAIVAATQSQRQHEDTKLAETFQVPASPAAADTLAFWCCCQIASRVLQLLLLLHLLSQLARRSVSTTARVAPDQRPLCTGGRVQLDLHSPL